MRDYLSDFLTPTGDENLKTPKGGKAHKAQKSHVAFGNTQGDKVSKGSKVPFEPFDTSPPKGFSKNQAAPTFEPSADVEGPRDLALMATTERIRLYRQRYHPTIDDENPEMHDSALFDVVVEVDFYDGRRIQIPQESTPPGWEAPF